MKELGLFQEFKSFHAGKKSIHVNAEEMTQLENYHHATPNE